MTTLGTIDFDDSIFDALRDEKLVVFAGAGVSIGPPSSLMGFQQLADDVAQGTGQVATHPLDRFLGELQHRKVSVHERAAHLLSLPGSAPNALHHDLIRLFRSSSGVRLVTTNFAQHFETAAHNLFGSLPDVYRAPALPLGGDFTGIVHVHGSLACHRSMVLTDADFGRAYLTEGWARRFLVEVFRRYTVLFIGYSHDDVVMNYLARALPTANAASRFALTDEEASWDLLGIKPIRFNKRTGADSYKELYESVQRLADRSNRGALDWQTRLTEIGGGAPPADEEAIGEVEQALREVHTTRFLLNVAMDSEWPRWLDARHHLNTLFEVTDLSERDKLLASWLAKSFAIEHPDAIFNLIAAHGMRLNPIFWRCIIRELDAMEHNRLKEVALKRWGTILLACTSDQTDHHALISLSELSARQGNIHLTLKVFFHMSEHRLNIKAGFNWQNQEDIEHGSLLEVECPLRSDHWSLEEVWTKHLKPKISLIAKILMSGITYRLETIHQDLMAWDKTSRDWDPISYRRSAIEVHEQDRYPNTTDVLIDAGRDTLEWLAAGSSAQLDAWIERLVSSDAPILRRLAVHAIAIHPGKSADERLLWLIDHLGLHGLAEHHEVHRVVALSYPAASL